MRLFVGSKRYRQPRTDWLEYLLAVAVIVVIVKMLTLGAKTRDFALIPIFVLALLVRRLGILYQDLRRRISEVGEKED